MARSTIVTFTRKNVRITSYRSEGIRKRVLDHIGQSGKRGETIPGFFALYV